MGRNVPAERKEKKWPVKAFTPTQQPLPLTRCFASLMVSLWAVAHAQAGQVSVGEGEERHEGDEPAVMGEVDGEIGARMNVAQHEERDEGQSGPDKQGELQAVVPRLGHGEEERASPFGSSLWTYPQVPVRQHIHFNVDALSGAKMGFWLPHNVMHRTGESATVPMEHP